MLRTIAVILVCFPFLSSLGQTFTGQVVDIDGTPLPYAIARWDTLGDYATANDSGYFSLPLPADTTLEEYTVYISFSGTSEYYVINDLFSQWTFTMDVRVQLDQVTIYDDATGSYISRIMPIKTEVINRSELRKAACCDLAGCFETQATVQPQTTNIITNAKELRILGLSGVYNQVLIDGLPLMQGLSYTYGLGLMAGSAVENIWVVKGANSVIQGYEGMVGQITIFPREGQTADLFTADALVNSFGEKHLNTGFATKKEKWNNYFAAHVSSPGGRFDRDDDNFMDLPMVSRYSFYNKWRYRNENETGLSSFVGLHYGSEKRVGGQMFFNETLHAGSTAAYGQVVNFTQPSVFTKTGYRFNGDTKISLLASLQQHQQQSWYGVLGYTGRHTHGYANLQFEKFFGPGARNDLKAGLSFRHLDVREDILFTSDVIPRNFDGEYNRLENIPGLFAETIIHLIPDSLTLITGVRADHHNTFGSFITPRMMVRYVPSQNTDIRISAGTGWRTVNLFAENINLLTSGRNVVFLEKPEAEESVNVGMNITQRFRIRESSFTATADVYHTRFSNQVFPDYDTHPDVALISNFRGTSISNGIQVELMTSMIKRIETRIAYNYLDVYRKTVNGKNALPYNPEHRILAVISYRTPIPGWQFDVNMHWYGRQRLPISDTTSDGYDLITYSDPYALTNLKLAYSTEQFDFFVGCENIFDFRQVRPIQNWENPFSTGFDTSFAWGPTRGREFFIGVVYHMKE